jgi:hypothetical protein
MPTHSRNRNPPATRRRALELLAASRDGCTEAIMLAHGFTVAQMVDLCVAGLAIATAERMVASAPNHSSPRNTAEPAHRSAPGGHESSAGQIASHVFQW